MKSKRPGGRKRHCFSSSCSSSGIVAGSAFSRQKDSARCDILVDRLKMLRALCNACSPVPEATRAYAHKRGALLQDLRDLAPLIAALDPSNAIARTIVEVCSCLP